MMWQTGIVFVVALLVPTLTLDSGHFRSRLGDSDLTQKVGETEFTAGQLHHTHNAGFNLTMYGEQRSHDDLVLFLDWFENFKTSSLAVAAEIIFRRVIKKSLKKQRISQKIYLTLKNEEQEIYWRGRG